MTTLPHYRGRFAPSPTGDLHFGSLIAAVGSYLQAKVNKGEWLLRIDDIDPPREVKGASKNILLTLEQFGFEWDGEVSYQSQNIKRYQEIVTHLLEQKLAYHCSCSRTDILNKTQQTKNQIIYPGFCRNGPLKSHTDTSIRLLTSHVATVKFDDAIQGKQSFDIEKTIGDFIIQRRDKHFSYHLASGYDDGTQGITEVVRGADLLSCTPQQLYIQQTLDLVSPAYCHLPVVINSNGQKLSKQSYAKPIEASNAVDLLYKTLKFLGQMPPNNLLKGSQQDIWLWAKAHWKLESVPHVYQLKE